MIINESLEKRWVEPCVSLKAPLHVRVDVVGLGNLPTKLKNWPGAERVKVFRETLQAKLGRGNAEPMGGNNRKKLRIKSVRQ